MSANHVGIIEPVGSHGGMNYYDFGLARGLVSAGINVTVFTCDSTEIPKGLPFCVKCTFRNIWGKDPKLIRAFRFIIGLLESLWDVRRNRISLVHFHFFQYTPMESLCIALARAFGVKIVVTAHDVKSFTGELSIRRIRRILAGADRVIAHNRMSRKELITNIQIPSWKIEVIPHGHYLDAIPEKPSPEFARQRLNLPQHIPVLLFFGQIKQVKGLDLLIEALPQVKKKFSGLKLVIAGKVWKDDFGRYEEIIQENHLEDNIELHIHYIPDEDVPLFYQAADLVILPYRRIYQSGVLLMAMSYGTAVLASNLEGMTEVIEADRNGFLFSTEDSNSLSKQIIYALSNPQMRKKVSETALETIRCKYNWQIIGQQTASIYQRTKNSA